MPAALLSNPEDGTSSGIMQYMQSLTTAPAELATALGDGVSSGLSTIRNHLGPSAAALDFTDNAGYRFRTTDWYGNDWHKIFDPDDDGSVDLTNVALAFVIIITLSQMGVPIVRMVSKGLKGIGTGLFRYNTKRRQDKLSEQLEDLERSTSRRDVTQSDKIDRVTLDNSELVVKLMNAIKYNNKSYLS
jgi:hypothetical protein